MPKRMFDVAVSLGALALLWPILAVLAITIRLDTPGPALHWSKRVGRDNAMFLMPKFRSMTIDAPQLPTHLLGQARSYVTPVGRFLRRTSLDELPQLWSVLVGRMSLVGPRPALFNQDDLVALRTARGVHLLAPGITGWAQVNGRDDLPIPVKVDYDAEYLRRRSFALDIAILARTVRQALSGHGVSH